MKLRNSDIYNYTSSVQNFRTKKFSSTSIWTSQHTSDFQAKFEMVWAEKICDRQKNRLERAERERPREKKRS